MYEMRIAFSTDDLNRNELSTIKDTLIKMCGERKLSVVVNSGASSYLIGYGDEKDDALKIESLIADLREKEWFINNVYSWDYDNFSMGKEFLDKRYGFPRSNWKGVDIETRTVFQIGRDKAVVQCAYNFLKAFSDFELVYSELLAIDPLLSRSELSEILRIHSSPEQYDS